MILEFLGYFWVLVVFGWLNGFASIKLYHWDNRRQEKKFMKHLRVEYPDSIITLSSLESTDREALNKLKEILDEDRAEDKDRV